MKLFFYLLYICTICFFSTTVVFSQSADVFDKEFLSENNNGFSDDLLADTKRPKWTFWGFVHNNNHFALNENDQNEYVVIKTEGRIRLNAKYGTSNMYAKTVLDGYYYPSGNEDNIPRDNNEIDIQEIYFTWGDSLKIKLGKQLFQWGTADAFTVTNYLDQFDNSESFVTDKDDRFRGVFAISVKYIFDEFALVGAATPIHNKPLVPAGYWEISPYSVSLGGNDLEVRTTDSENKKSAIDNISYAVRFGGTVGFFDFHMVYFNGFNNNIIYTPNITKDNSDSYLKLETYYQRIQAGGFDTAFTLDKLSVRAEVSFCHNMPGVIKPGDAEYGAAYSAAISGPSGNYNITSIEKTKYLSYVIGADYNVWGDNGRVLIEWMQAKYVNDKYVEPLFSKLLLLSIQDKFYNEHLSAEIKSTIRLQETAPGFLINVNLGWDFKTGLTINTGLYVFQANDDELFSQVDSKDMFFLQCKMEY